MKNKNNYTKPNRIIILIVYLIALLASIKITTDLLQLLLMGCVFNAFMGYIESKIYADYLDEKKLELMNKLTTINPMINPNMLIQMTYGLHILTSWFTIVITIIHILTDSLKKSEK